MQSGQVPPAIFVSFFWSVDTFSRTPPNKPLPFTFCSQPHPTALAHPPLLTTYTINMAKESRMTRNNARYEPYNSSPRPNHRQESPPLNSLRNQPQIHHQQPDGSIYGFLDDLYSCYGGADMAQLFRKYAGQSGVLGEGITMWLLSNDVSPLPHYGSPSRPTYGWLIGNFRCASIARRTLSTPPRLKRLIP